MHSVSTLASQTIANCHTPFHSIGPTNETKLSQTISLLQQWESSRLTPSACTLSQLSVGLF